MKANPIYPVVLFMLSCATVFPAIGCGPEKASSRRSWADRSQQIARERLMPPEGSLNFDKVVHVVPEGSGSRENADAGRASTFWPKELSVFRLAANVAGGPETQPAEAAKVEGKSTSERRWRQPLPSFGGTVKRDVLELPGVLWDDTKRVYTNPCNVIFLLGAGGASLALRPEADDEIEDFYDNHHTFSSGWRDAFGAAGNPLVHFGLAGAWYLTGQLAQDAKTYDVGTRMFRALILNGISVTLLKTAACTESPNGEDWAWPSGHVSSSMVMATVLNDAYGPLVGIPMFSLTGLVAIERLDSREHVLSDVVFGAALGWVIAETVMKDRPPEIAGGQLVPYVDPAGRNAGVAWVKSLDAH